MPMWLLPPPWTSSAIPTEADFELALFSRHYKLPVQSLLRYKFPFLAEHLVVTGNCDLVLEISALLNQRVVPGASEQDTVALVSRFAKYMAWLAKLASPPTTVDIRMDRAEVVGSGIQRISQSAGPGSPRPDLVASIFGLSILFGEFKGPDDELHLAWADIDAKLGAGFPPLFYANVPFIPVLVATMASIQFGLLSPNGQKVKVGPVLLLGTIQDLLTTVFAFTNLHYILRHLASLAAPEDQRVPLNQLLRFDNDVTVMVNGKTAVKTIPNSVFTDIGTSFAVVKAAHDHANSCDSLVSTQSVVERSTRKRHVDGTQIRECVVTMDRLGYPKRQLTEEEKKAAVLCCLKAAGHLQKATPRLVHCDIRLPNILWGPEPFLADLEMAHTDPWQVGANMARPRQWNDGTLDENDRYTWASDLHQIGVMMKQEMGPLTVEAQELAALLQKKPFTVAQALQHAYLAAP